MSGERNSRDIETAALAAAELIDGLDEVLIIGSQAIHATVADPPIDAVRRSPDVDFVPFPYREELYVFCHEYLGQDSAFHEKHGFYAEIVRPTLPVFPRDFRERAIVREMTVTRHGAEYPVRVSILEIHDLVVSKLNAGRSHDYEFVEDTVRLGYIDKVTLEARVAETPFAPERREGLIAFIDATFAKYGRT